jgi:hypothetical protein
MAGGRRAPPCSFPSVPAEKFFDPGVVPDLLELLVPEDPLPVGEAGFLGAYSRSEGTGSSPIQYMVSQIFKYQF